MAEDLKIEDIARVLNENVNTIKSASVDRSMHEVKTENGGNRMEHPMIFMN